MRKMFAMLAVTAVATTAMALCPPSETTVNAAKTGDGGCCPTATQTVAAVVQDGDCGGCTEGQVVAAVTGDAEAPQVPAGMPMMTILVGDKATHCPMEAQKLAAETEATPVYVVRGIKFDCPMDAGTVYARALTAYYYDITTPQLVVNGECQECPVSAAKYAEETGKPALVRVAGTDFHCPVQAREATIAAIEAGEAVAMSISVNGTDCNGCTATAAKLSEQTGEPTVYAINDVEVHCPVQAKCVLAMKKIEAAMQAAAKVASQEETTVATSN